MQYRNLFPVALCISGAIYVSISAIAHSETNSSSFNSFKGIKKSEYKSFGDPGITIKTDISNCKSTPSSKPRQIIKINLNHIFKDLGDTGDIDVKAEADPDPNASTDPGSPVGIPQYKADELPTRLDFSVKTGSMSAKDYIIVKVILPRTNGSGKPINKNTHFMFPYLLKFDPSLAIRPNKGSESMICGIDPIHYAQPGDKNDWVKFGLRSVGSPADGGFNLGLYIGDDSGVYNIPIYIDPKVGNDGSP